MKKAKKKKEMTKGAVIAMTLFASPFLLWGIYSAYYFAKTSAEYSDMQTWVEVPATINSAEMVDNRRSRGIGKTKGSSRTMHKVVATYSYEIDGKKYASERVSLYKGSDGDSKHHHSVYDELKRHLDAHRPFRCFVNPDDPQQAVLYRDWRWNVSGLHLMHAVLFGGLGLFLIGSSLYYWRKQERGKRFRD